MNEQATKVVGRRVLAYIIDAVVLLAINFAIFFALAEDPVRALARGDVEPTSTVYGNFTLGDQTYSVYGGKAALWFLLGLAITLGYVAVWQGLKGVTLGKLAAGIRTVREEDPTQPPGIGRALARWFLYIADAFPYFIPMLTGFIVALNQKQNKRIGDMVAGTLVVRRDAEVSRAAAPAPPPALPSQP
jgi:uncharacterized RDD family membrane protein YckC